jgi:hypothetical protein
MEKVGSVVEFENGVSAEILTAEPRVDNWCDDRAGYSYTGKILTSNSEPLKVGDTMQWTTEE